MSRKIPPADLERIEFAAQVLRRVRKRDKKRSKAFAASLLNECAGREWPLPPALKLLILEMLLDVSVVSPGKPFDSVKSKVDSEELKKMSDLLISEFDKAIANVNNVGAPKYWKAVDYEAAHPDDPSGGAPSSASLSAVEKNSGARRDTVRRWRRDAAYRENVRNRRANRGGRNL